MNTQVNLRIPDQLLKRITKEAKMRGYSTIQAFILETMREEVMDLSPKERQALAKVLREQDREERLLGEKESWKMLDSKPNRKISGKRTRTAKNAAVPSSSWHSPSISTPGQSSISKASARMHGN